MNYCEIISGISEFLRHPFVISLFSLFVGSCLINRINYLKASRDMRKNEAIKLANAISERINAPLSLIYARIRQKQSIDCEDFNTELRHAYTFRLRMGVASQFYFGSREAAMQYDSIVKEMRKIRDFMRARESENEAYLIALAVKYREELQNKWNIQVPDTFNPDQQGLNQAILCWADVVWKYADSYLMSLLKRVDSL